MNSKIHTPGQLGKVLRGYRKSRGLTQEQAAKLVGLLPKTISGLELTPEQSKVESLFKLLSALDLELEMKPKHAGRDSRLIRNKKVEW